MRKRCRFHSFVCSVMSQIQQSNTENIGREDLPHIAVKTCNRWCKVFLKLFWSIMSLRSGTLIGLFLVLVLIGGALNTPVRERETMNENTPLDLLFDPESFTDQFTLMDDYGVRPVPPRVPSYLLSSDSSGLEED
ncbi:hypothetical protein KOW79_009407 [Hemibagrus wyckioides]|uniref:Uncharacterized protein n=1 Tax=Hemibagrus wyckioides TaxID=337641 RepID=A0A9D3SKD7_9TELE|nr:hypothetical protein KOW79_009407 [Hemibagrus wyckioides]